MEQAQTKELLRTVKQSLDGLLLRDRARLNALMRRVRQRIHDRKPTGQLAERLRNLHIQALENARVRAETRLEIDYPQNLPISGKRGEIRRLIENHQVVVVCGTTGSGKTTQLPKIALEAGCGKWGRIGVTQPRRLAATGMARRVAEEMRTGYGEGVGCQVRFGDDTSSRTRVKFMTDGILLAETRNDRHLLQYDCLIVDEAHERSLNIDFILGYLKNLARIRPDLKIVISSATLDAAAFSEFFDNAPVIEVEGRTYPIEDFFLPPKEDETLADHLLRAVRRITEIDDRGDILAFLPGEREIREATRKLEGQQWRKTEILPLFGRLGMGDQQRVFRVGGRRRIILATNVAETSITIPGIHYVVDSGLVRLGRYNPRTQVQGLQVEQVSQASARQRRGRCGRVADGICIHLYSRETLENSPAYTDPEIRRTALAGVILQMNLLGLPPIDRFPLIDPPRPALVREGYRALSDIGAIDADGKLTETGREIVRYPVDPHLARMVLHAQKEGVVAEILTLVAFLSIQDVRERPAEKAEEADQAHRRWQDPRSDFLAILNLWNALEECPSHGKLRAFCRQNFVNFRRVLEWRNLRRELQSTCALRAEHPTSSPEERYDPIHRSLLAGLPANIGRKGEEREFTAARNRKFFIFPGSGLFKKPPGWVVAFALVETTRLYARTVAEIQPEWLEEVAPHLCKAVYEKPEWNPEKGFVYARESILSGGLVLLSGRPVHYGPINPAEARKIFIREGMAPANLRTRGGWLRLHRRMLDDIQTLEEKIRRPGALLDPNAIFDHFDRLLPNTVYSVKSLENWLRKSHARIAMRMEEAIYPQTDPIRQADYPDFLEFGGEPFQLIYTFEPGDELDGIALVCPSEKLALLPEWATDWLVPGWLPEKVARLLRTLPKNLRNTLSPIDKTSDRFVQSVGSPQAPLLPALAAFLQSEFSLPVDATDFDEAALPGFLRMKVIETDGDRIVKIHAAISADHRQAARESGARLAFAKWRLPPGREWPGGALPEFILANDSHATRGHPALTDEAGGVGRQAFLDPFQARASHRAGLVRLFRIRHADQVAYAEKRPPFPPMLQLALSAIDEDFLADLVDTCIFEALTNDGKTEIRDPETFDRRAAEARATLCGILSENAEILTGLLRQREEIAKAIAQLRAEPDSIYDLEMQLAFLFRPGFLQTPEIFSRYPRYLRAMQIRIQRIANNAPADLRKLAEILPFQNRLNDALLECDDIDAAHGLLEFAMLLEEFRVNRFAPEIKTPVKTSPRRLDEAWEKRI